MQQRCEGVYVATAPAAAPGYATPMMQYWKQAINDTALAGTAAVVQELEKQGYVKLWVEGYGAGAASPPGPGPPPQPKPPPPPKPPPRFECFGGPPGKGVCAKSTSPNATYVNDSSCDSNCPPAPEPPKQPAAYEIPAQQFGFTAVPSAIAGEDPTIMYGNFDIIFRPFLTHVSTLYPTPYGKPGVSPGCPGRASMSQFTFEAAPSVITPVYCR